MALVLVPLRGCPVFLCREGRMGGGLGGKNLSSGD